MLMVGRRKRRGSVVKWIVGEVTKSRWCQDEIQEKRNGWDGSACKVVV